MCLRFTVPEHTAHARLSARCSFQRKHAHRRACHGCVLRKIQNQTGLSHRGRAARIIKSEAWKPDVISSSPEIHCPDRSASFLLMRQPILSIAVSETFHRFKRTPLAHPGKFENLGFRIRKQAFRVIYFIAFQLSRTGRIVFAKAPRKRPHVGLLSKHLSRCLSEYERRHALW